MRASTRTLSTQSLGHRWQLSATTGLLMLAWILSMILVPIAGWTNGATLRQQMLVVSVVLQAALVANVLVHAWGWRRSGTLFAAIALVTYAVEWLGSTSGFPFGPYRYTAQLQPQLAHVPLIIPLAWFMMVPAAWATVHRFRQRRLAFAFLAGAALTAWDLLLDPQMVAWGFWVWETPGAYFGIPLSNFLGWLATGTILSLLIPAGDLPVRPLLLVFTVTWFLETLGLALFWGLPGPALVGGLAMGFFVWHGWRQPGTLLPTPRFGRSS